MNGELCTGIYPPPPLKFSPPLFQGKPPFNPEIFQPPSPPPFLKFWLESQSPPLYKGGCPLWSDRGERFL